MLRRKIAEIIGIQEGAATEKGAGIGTGEEVGKGNAAETARGAETGKREAVPGREEGLNYILFLDRFYKSTFDSIIR